MQLHVLHGLEQLVVRLGQHVAHLRDVARGTNTGNDVLTLRVDKELAVDALLAGGWVTGEADAGCGSVAAVAEHHLHDVNCRAQVARDVVGLAVDVCARVAPRTEYRVDCAHQLLVRVVSPVAAELLVADLLEFGNQLLEVFGVQIGVALDALVGLHGAQRVLVVVGRHALDDLAVHLNEATVAVPSEALVAGFRGDGLHSVVVDAQVQDRVHHARHRDDSTGTHRNQQRLGGVAEFASDALLELRQGGGDLVAKIGRPVAVVVHRFDAGLGGDGKAVGNRHAQTHHFGQVCALAAK